MEVESICLVSGLPLRPGWCHSTGAVCGVGRWHTSYPPSPPQLAQGAERCSKLGREELWLFPGREVPTFVDLVEVDQVVIRPLGPAAWRTIILVGKDRQGHRNGAL